MTMFGEELNRLFCIILKGVLFCISLRSLWNVFSLGTFDTEKAIKSEGIKSNVIYKKVVNYINKEVVLGGLFGFGNKRHSLSVTNHNNNSKTNIQIKTLNLILHSYNSSIRFHETNLLRHQIILLCDYLNFYD